MDIEDAMYSTTTDLLSLRYPSLSGATATCGGGGSLLLSSPWPIPSTPSPPSSLSSVSSSVSASSPSSTTSGNSLNALNESTLLSLSSGSPSGQDLQVTSPLPPGGRGGGGILEEVSSSHHHNAGGTTVIFTTAGTGASGAALTLVDPVSSPALEVAHAPGKSILCVHEQEHGDLIHFSTSNSNNNGSSIQAISQHNHVNGNGNENRGITTTAATTTLLETASVIDNCKGGGGEYGLSGNNTDTATDTDGNLFPTLILTSGGGGSMADHVIPMRLYTSLTSSNTNSSTINGSTILTSGGGHDGADDNATCILMTTRQGDDDCNGGDLHHVLLSGVAHHQDQGQGTFTLAGFAEQMGLDGGQTSTNLGTTTILMDECFTTSASGKGQGDPFGGSSTKLKDILMNGSSGNGHNSHHHNSHQRTLSSTNGNGESYILRELDGTPTVVYDNRVSNITSAGNCQSGTGELTSFVIPKEEEGLEELKLHSVDDQTGFNELSSIYQSSGASHIMVTGGGDDRGPSTSAGDHNLGQAIYNTGSILAIAPSSSSLGGTITTNSVIWSNSGGIVESVGGSSGGMVHFIEESGSSSPFLMKDDIGDLDEIEDDDLLEAKEEMDEELYGDMDEVDDGTGAKGELKCKFCGFVCCSKSSLGIHERRHTGERPFACKYCGRLFNSAQCCKHHERLHTGDKPFQCSYCGKKYAVSTRLKRHERVHTREEPYKCTECNKTFRWFDAFRDHRNTHTGVPLYLCSVCGKTFTSYLKFYYHERGHLMKKERDRDRLAKQRLANGLAPSTTPWPSKRVHYSRNRSVPISHTIDILKSLQKNSSASIISSLSQQAQQISNMLTVSGPGAGGKKAGGSKGQSKKSQGKGKKQQQNSQQQVSNGGGGVACV